jgi:hypothetical protein
MIKKEEKVNHNLDNKLNIKYLINKIYIRITIR